MPELNPEKVRRWLNEINLGLKWREEYEKVWIRTIEYLKGEYLKEASSEDEICINLVRPHVSVVIPAVYSKNPDVLVRPTRLSKMGDELARKRAEVLQNVLRYVLRELDLKTETKLCLLDGIIAGHAWNKTGFETEFVDLTKEEQNDETLVSKFLKALGMKQEDVTDEENYLLHQKIISGKVWSIRVSIFDIIVPALSKRVEDLRWITHRFILPTDEVKSDDNLDARARRLLKPSVTANQIMRYNAGPNYKDLPMAEEIDYNIVYEVFDRKTKKVFMLSEDCDLPLQERDSGYTFLDSKHHPFTMLRMNEVNDEFYPEGDIKPAEAQLLELNDLRTQMNTHRKRFNRKYKAKEGALSPEAKQQLRDGEDGAVIEISSTFADDALDNTFSPITDASLPSDVYAVESRIKDDIFTILGTSDYASSASGGARTATEASIIATQSRFRVEERIDGINKFIEQITRNIALIMMRYMDQNEIIKIIGDDGIFWEQLFDDDELRSEYRFEIISGSSAPINRDVDKEQFMKFYALVRDDPYFNQPKIRFELARKFMLEQPESWINPQIAAVIEKQRMEAAMRGELLVNPNAQAGGKGVGNVPRGNEDRLPTGQPTGLPGDISSEEPEIPGGRGGTALDSAGV